MVACRPLSGLLAALLALVALHFTAGLATGQDNISTDLLTADDLSNEQQQRIDSYVASWCQQLHDGDDADVTRSRQRLAEPLNNPTEPSTTFTGYYSPKLAECLLRGLETDRLIVRLNAMIVVTYMVTEDALPLIEQGLGDENPGVRYWAAKAVQRLASREVWTRAQQVQLLQQLTDRLGQEQTGWVVQQLMLAIVGLELPEAAERMLTALNERVEGHAENPGRAIQAEQTGLERLYRELLGEGDRAALRQLARTGYRYMRLAGTHLERGHVPEGYRPGYAEVIDVADTIMRTVNEELNGSQELPEATGEAVRQQDWDRVLVIADRWEQVLQEPPFNFDRETLSVIPSDDEGDEAENDEAEDADNTDAAPAPLPPAAE
ncbi:MAG: HEAT repeat domain-containing protein [Phycisphaeraceae bacterium]